MQCGPNLNIAERLACEIQFYLSAVWDTLWGPI
jgi:hypothetical protein